MKQHKHLKTLLQLAVVLALTSQARQVHASTPSRLAEQDPLTATTSVVEEHTETSTQTVEFSQHNTIPNAYETLAGNYLAVLNHYTEKYGVSNGQSQGLASSRLIDFNGDGTRELLLTYRTNSTTPAQVTTEIWDIQEGQAVLQFQYFLQQKFEYVNQDNWTDWRDVLTLGSYQNGYILNFAGGGSAVEYSTYKSYDKIFAYSQGTVKSLGDILMIQHTVADDYYINGLHSTDYFIWYSYDIWLTEFKRIQNTYLQGNTTELLYIDQNSVTMDTTSAQGELQQMLSEHGGSSGEVLLSASGGLLPQHAQIWKNLINDTISKYGYIEDKDVGYGSSRLVDFDGDGVDELILTYRPFLSLTEDNMTLEIWQIQGDSPVKIFSFEGDSNYENGTKSYSLLPYHGVWGLYETSDTEGSHKIYVLQGQQFQETFFISSFEPFDGPGAWFKINGTSTSSNAFYAELKKIELQNAELLLAENHPDVSYTANCWLSEIELALAQAQPSNHYYGYPVVQGNSVTTELSGELLALYQVEDSLYYGIVEVNGKQEGRVLAKDTSGNWEVRHSSTENLSYETLEAEKLAYLTPEIAPEIATETVPESTTNNSSSTTSSTSQDSKPSTMDYVAMGAIIFGVLGLSGYGIYTMKQKKS